MDKVEFKSFYAKDSNSKLADILLNLLKNGEADKPYNLQELGILDAGDEFQQAIKMHTYVELSIQDGFHAGADDKVVSNEAFWKGNKMLAHKCPHWNRRTITVNVYNKSNINDKKHPIMNMSTWFSAKNKSYAELCLGALMFEPKKQQDGVDYEWNSHHCVQTDDSYAVDLDINRTVIMSLMKLSKDLQKEGDAKMQKIFDMFEETA